MDFIIAAFVLIWVVLMVIGIIWLLLPIILFVLAFVVVYYGLVLFGRLLAAWLIGSGK